MKIILKLIFIAYLIQHASEAAAQCPLNELYYNSTISPICDINCQNLQRRCPLSSVRPVAGCYCRANYARNLQQQCIPQSKCAKDCFRNEIANNHETKSCENFCRVPLHGFRLNICYHSQERRCICAPGYCRNRSGQCTTYNT